MTKQHITKDLVINTFAQYLDDNPNKVSAIALILKALFEDGKAYLTNLARSISADRESYNRNYNYIRKIATQLSKRGIIEHKREMYRVRDKDGRVRVKPGKHYWVLSLDFIYIFIRMCELVKFEKRIREGKV